MKDAALKLALDALEEAWYHVGTFQPTEKAIDLYDEARTAIKAALAQQDQETVFFGVKDQGVKVSSLEFVTRVMGKEEVIGKPIFWAEWPSKENT